MEALLPEWDKALEKLSCVIPSDTALNTHDGAFHLHWSFHFWDSWLWDFSSPLMPIGVNDCEIAGLDATYCLPLQSKCSWGWWYPLRKELGIFIVQDEQNQILHFSRSIFYFNLLCFSKYILKGKSSKMGKMLRIISFLITVFGVWDNSEGCCVWNGLGHPWQGQSLSKLI